MMETSARYVLIGLFALLVVLGGFGFVYWLNNSGGFGERTAYRIKFETPVSGLLLGSSVVFNGIKVGEVTGLGLDPSDPGGVVATIAVDQTTPVRTDTRVGLSFGGLTGQASIALTGGSPTAPPLAATGGEPALLNADASAAQDWTAAAREAFSSVNRVLEENSAPLKSAVASIDTFAAALARNSGKVDSIAAGLEKLTGGGQVVQSVIYELNAPTDFPADLKVPEGQLVVTQPTTMVTLDTQRFIIRNGDAEKLGFDDSKWVDSVPLMFRSRIIQSFENAKFMKVGSDEQDLNADRRLLIEVRAFEVVEGATPTAICSFTAKIVTGQDGEIGEAKTFEASVPLKAMDAASAAAALNEAFGKTATELVTWVVNTI